MDFALFSFIGACLTFLVNVLVYRFQKRRMDYVNLYPNVENESLLCGKDEELGFYKRPDYVTLYDDMCVKILVFRFISRVLRATVVIAIFLHFLPIYLALFFGYVFVLFYEDILAYFIALNLIDEIDIKLQSFLNMVLQTTFFLHVFSIIFYVISLLLFGENWWSNIMDRFDIVPILF